MLGLSNGWCAIAKWPAITMIPKSKCGTHVQSIGMQQSRNPNEEGSSNFLSKHTYTYNKFLQFRSSSKFFCIICRNQLRSNSFLWRLEFTAAGHYLNIFQFISPKCDKLPQHIPVYFSKILIYSSLFHQNMRKWPDTFPLPVESPNFTHSGLFLVHRHSLKHLSILNFTTFLFLSSTSQRAN